MNTAIIGALLANPYIFFLKLAVEPLPAALVAYGLLWYFMRPKDGRRVRRPFLYHSVGVIAAVTGGAMFRIFAMVTFGGRGAYEPVAETDAYGFYMLIVPATVAAGYIAWLKSQLSIPRKPAVVACHDNAAYAAALTEIEEHRLDRGTWARSFAESGGDESKAEALYIKTRAESMQHTAVWVDTQSPGAEDAVIEATSEGQATSLNPLPVTKSMATSTYEIGVWVILVLGGIAWWQYLEYTKGQAVAASQVQALGPQLDLSELQKAPAPEVQPSASGPWDTKYEQKPQPTPLTGTLDKLDPSTAHPVDSASPTALKTAEQVHFGLIEAAHPDSNAISSSPDFQSWVAKYPTYRRIFSQGTAQEVIDMLTAYKNQR